MITLSIVLGIMAMIVVAGIVAGATLPYLHCVGPKRDIWIGLALLAVLLLALAAQLAAVVRINL